MYVAGYVSAVMSVCLYVCTTGVAPMVSMMESAILGLWKGVPKAMNLDASSLSPEALDGMVTVADCSGMLTEDGDPIILLYTYMERKETS